MPSRYFRQKPHEVGLPPGTLVHIGKTSSPTSRVDAIIFDTDEIIINESIDVTKFDRPADSEKILWLDVKGLGDLETLSELGSKFDVHPLVLEDILSSTQRPKIEDYHDSVFIVIRSLRYDDVLDRAEAEQVCFVMGQNFLITFRDSDYPMFDSIIQRLKIEKSRLREGKADYLTYACMDIVVDNYFHVLERIGDRIEDIEDALVSKPKPKTLGAIHQMKTDLIFIRKSLWPLREMVSRMLVGDTPFINDSLRPYLRDLFDHAVHAIDTVEAFRDISSGMIDIYLSSVSNKLSETMRVLAIIATFFMPLTFLCGWYGMNFDDMPELKWRYGYPIIILVATSIATSMIIFFRKKKWI